MDRAGVRPAGRVTTPMTQRSANLEHRHDLDRQHHVFDVVVVGGGMAGLCAALAAARHGARTALVHDRPVLGGNASSEVRMWICGAHGADNAETGILEEIQLDNLYRNAPGNYSIWDATLYNKIAQQPRLTPFLNTSCTGCEASGPPDHRTIHALHAWQLTTQTWHTLEARLFIDCSGDSILAPHSGALHRWGRESREEFGEDIAPAVADRKTMGNSILIQLRRTDEPQPFTPPPFAVRFESPEELPFRISGVQGHNFWWIELGGLDDTIADAERLRDELVACAWGVWDYIKNVSPAREEAATWALEWIGALPGKRENRRYQGLHMLTQHDVQQHGRFDDIVGYGGWSMDDHHPAGLLYPGRPTIFHPAPSPYGIPLRCLISANVANLMFAGRNISATHAALSSTRVMATCAVLGQAAGTAAALALRRSTTPRGLLPDHQRELQHLLMDDDAYLPGLTRPIDPLSLKATVSDGELTSGVDRELRGSPNCWSGPLNNPHLAPTLSWSQPVDVAGVRIVFDSDLKANRKMPCSYPRRNPGHALPKTLVKAFRVEVRRDGAWVTAYRDDRNHQRLRRLPLHVRADAVRIVPESTWAGGGDDVGRLFAFEALSTIDERLPVERPRPLFRAMRDAVAPSDLAAPDHGLESLAKPTTRLVGA